MVQGVRLIVDYKRNGAYWWLPEELILSGTYQCSIGTGEDGLILHAISWIVGCVWEVVALCLATGIAVKHFRELRRHPAGGIMEDCFMVLIKAHMLYCARWARIVLPPFFFYWRVGRGSSITVYCFNAILYFTPAPSVVCQFFTNLCMVPRFIISIGRNFPGQSDLFWACSGFDDLADGRARTPPNP
jgi:hypothetical protein